MKKKKKEKRGLWKRGPTAPAEEKGIQLRDLNAAEAEGSKIRTGNGNNNDDEKYKAVILAK